MKPFTPEELLDRVRGIVARIERTRGSDADLASREKEVLVLLSAGRTDVEIAERLVVSENTVAIHIDQILSRLGAHNRAHAVRDRSPRRRRLTSQPRFRGRTCVQVDPSRPAAELRQSRPYNRRRG